MRLLDIKTFYICGQVNIFELEDKKLKIIVKFH